MANQLSTVVFLVVLLGYVHGLRVNMTRFSNCQDLKLQYDRIPVSLTKVTFDRDADGVANTMHAEYDVRAASEEVQWELILTSYKCPLGGGSTICVDNPKEYVEEMHCDRFHADDSGPWFMLSSAMSNGDKCGRAEGHFNLDSAILKIKYLQAYTELGTGTYRIKMLFHVPHTDMAEKNVKGCCEMDFDVID
ncbi:uncharacterized protein LOC120413142 [Culex pipiens pallens]|uniref:uncharacterized protein LOC120413142 n=1 Tax=Culex pipiens pallens TaxID=42434 RepID=UPI00195413FB|nr:uncharacterized protein LOC120413142 [Culex pipiens pallens]